MCSKLHINVMPSTINVMLSATGNRFSEPRQNHRKKERHPNSKKRQAPLTFLKRDKCADLSRNGNRSEKHSELTPRSVSERGGAECRRVPRSRDGCAEDALDHPRMQRPAGRESRYGDVPACPGPP